jgi:hypothetical protein
MGLLIGAELKPQYKGRARDFLTPPPRRGDGAQCRAGRDALCAVAGDRRQDIEDGLTALPGGGKDR